MTDEKMLELAEQAGVVRAKGDWCIFDESELRKFAALVRREALEEAQWECKRMAVRHGGTQRGRGAQDCVDVVGALAAQEES